MGIDWNSLQRKATGVLSNAYAPYSNYQVAAALLTTDDKVFTGVNIENASYGLTICAERNAIASAVVDGSKQFEALVVLSGGTFLPIPCGACRQVLMEFAPDLRILCLNSTGKEHKTTIQTLLPSAFEFKAEH